MAQVFAYGANCPAFDVDQLIDEIRDTDNCIAQAIIEMASVLSMAAGKQISTAMRVEKLQLEIQIGRTVQILAASGG